jgi:DNA-binding CsgD family transcriptional regulator
MERLRQSELRSLLAFVQECSAIRDFDTFEAFIPPLIAACQRLIPSAHMIGFSEMKPATAESRNCFNIAELNDRKWDQLWEQHMQEHPVLTHFLETGDRNARRISDFLSQRQFHDTGLYEDVYRRWEVHDVLCAMASTRPPWIRGVAWHSDRPFSENERLLADLVRPHIAQACRNARFLAGRSRELRMLRAGMESLNTGVILCNGLGQISFISALARHYLEDYLSAARQMDHHLPDHLLRWMRTQELPGARIDDALPVRAPLILEKDNNRLVLRLLTQSGTHLILIEEEKRQPEKEVPPAFRLTSREAEVLRWIARGKTNQEIAIILGLQAATVKKHVEHILMKLGVETRTAAAAMVLGGGPPIEAN